MTPPTLHYKTEKSRRVAFGGSEPSMFYVYNMEVEDGRMFTDAEVLHHSKVVVFGHSPRRDLLPNLDPIGKTISIDGQDFTIIGVLAERRTTEIGIRKAVGAIRRHILWQFLIEAGTLTGLGDVLVVILGLSVAFGVSRLMGIPFSMSPFLILSAVAFSVSVGMLFGLYPASRASKQNSIQAIGCAR